MTPAGARLAARARRVLACLLLATGAGNLARAQAEEEGTASLRVLHLSPDAPLVDVLVDGRLELRDVRRRARSDYLDLPSGRHEIRVYPHRLPDAGGGEVPPAPPTPPPEEAVGSGEANGGDGTADGAAAEGAADAAAEEGADEVRARPLEPVTAIVDLPAGSYTTVVLTGSFEPPTSEGGLGHLSIAVEPADARVAVQGPQGYLVQRSGDQWLTDLEPGVYGIEVGREGFAPAQYEVEVQPESTSVVTLTLQAGEGETPDAETVPTGGPDATRVRWRRLELQPYSGPLPLPPAGRSLVRFVHAAPTVPGLSVAVRPATDADATAEDVEGEADAADRPPPVLRIDALAYPNESDYRALPAGRYALGLRIAGTESVLHAVPEFRLRPGSTYTFFLAADPVGGWIEVVPIVDATIPQRPLAEEAP